MSKPIKMMTLAVLFALTSGMGLARISHAQSDFDVQKAISAGDHAGLANYYKAQAQAYRDKAAKHDNMHADYKKSHVHYKGMENSLAAHCSILKERALETAKQYDDLAAEEEKLTAKGK